MPMNVQPVPTLDERINDIRMRTAEIINKDLLPNEGSLWAYRRGGEVTDHQRREAHELREQIKARVWEPGSGRPTSRQSMEGWV
jgi:acyl-CoA dehydrogenase